MIEVTYTNDKDSIKEALDQLNVGNAVKHQKKILIKPNVVNKSPFPITTRPEFVEAIVEYIKEQSDAEIVVGEGGGMPDYSTYEAFEVLGYDEMAKRQNVELLDLNEAPMKRLEDSRCRVHQEMYLPEMIDTHYIISVPVIKAHSLADITGAIKNMMGLLPPKHYRGRYGVWNKAVFHNRMQDSLWDLYTYVKPDLSIMDASVGLAEFHLGGPTCNPPIGKVLASYDARELDRRSAELLGFDWRRIGHLKD